MKKFIIACTASLLCMAVSAPHPVCFAAKKASKKVSITFSKSTDTMENGTKFKFKAKVKNAKASKVTYQSSNAKIIKINKKTGAATAKKIGKATITATIGKKLVRRTVTVSPSIQNIANANDTYKNLKNGIFTSVFGTAVSNTTENDTNMVYKTYVCLDEGKNLLLYETVENSYFHYVNNGICYTLDNADNSNVTSKDFSESENPNNTFIHYSNLELISAEIQPDSNYHLVYMADIGGMTEAEQNSVGLDSGICVMDVIAEAKHLLIQSYKITNYSSDGTRATTVSGTFVYNGENELTLPNEIQIAAGSAEPAESTENPQS